jgi:hypothetical protein
VGEVRGAGTGYGFSPCVFYGAFAIQVDGYGAVAAGLSGDYRTPGALWSDGNMAICSLPSLFAMGTPCILFEL